LAQRVVRDTAVLFRDPTAEGVSGQQHALAALYPQERAGTYCTGEMLGPRAVVDGRKILPPTAFDPSSNHAIMAHIIKKERLSTGF